MSIADAVSPQIWLFLTLVFFFFLQYLVLVLYRYLHYSPDVCIKGNWQIGHKILASVTRLLLNFKIKPIFGQTAELLQYMTLYYGDVGTFLLSIIVFLGVLCIALFGAAVLTIEMQQKSETELHFCMCL
jgi:hypothetical protein